MTIWYYGEDGNNANSGLSFAQRKATYENFRASIQPGDTIYICPTNTSDVWDCTEQLRVVSGSSGNWVTYKVYQGFVRFDVSTTSSGGVVDGKGAITGTNNSWFKIEPDAGELILGDFSQWQPNDGAGGWQEYSAACQLSFTNCNNFALIGTGVGSWSTPSNFTVFGGSAYTGNWFDSDCENVLIYGIDFSRHGTNNTKDFSENPESDDGDMVVIDSRRVVVENCCFKYGGHQNIAPRIRFGVIRNCEFNGDWEGVTDNADEGRGAPIERSGGRSFAIIASDQQHGAISPYGPNLVENCIMQRAGSAGDEHDNANAQLHGLHVIFRGNYMWDGCDVAIETATHNDFDDNTLGLLKIYNNTMYGNGRVMNHLTVDVFDGLNHYCDFFNNICDEMQGAYFQGADRAQYWKQAIGESLDGFSNFWKGGRYSGNIFKVSSSAPEGDTTTFEVRTETAAQDTYTLAEIEDEYPSNWFDNVTGTSPTYAGNPGGGVRTKAAFAMNGGNGAGNAVYHARANGGQTNHTTLIVDAGQAYNFKGDWGFASWIGEEPDWIQIGSTEPVQIASINYAAHTITLSEPRTWSDNDEIYLCTTTDGGNNFTVWTDVGASQSAAEITPDPFEPVRSSTVMVF